MADGATGVGLGGWPQCADRHALEPWWSWAVSATRRNRSRSLQMPSIGGRFCCRCSVCKWQCALKARPIGAASRRFVRDLAVGSPDRGRRRAPR